MFSAVHFGETIRHGFFKGHGGVPAIRFGLDFKWGGEACFRARSCPQAAKILLASRVCRASRSRHRSLMLPTKTPAREGARKEVSGLRW